MTETNISIARVPQVTVIDPRIPEKAKLRVAAYARVSSDSEDQVNSYIAQVDFYTKHIAGKEDWEMVDIYADEGISGLEARNRDDFNRMMADCREGKIDRVLCKSIRPQHEKAAGVSAHDCLRACGAARPDRDKGDLALCTQHTGVHSVRARTAPAGYFDPL